MAQNPLLGTTRRLFWLLCYYRALVPVSDNVNAISLLIAAFLRPMHLQMHCMIDSGSRISLISKKNIRYEGTLYSINESNATVALQNVRSYGTEGREKLDPTSTFVAPQDSVHPYLLFRGCDIKDLHVHENAVQQPPSDPAIMSSDIPPEPPQQQPTGATAAPSPQDSAASGQNETKKPQEGKEQAEAADGTSNSATPRSRGKDDNRQNKQPGRGSQGHRRQKKTNPASQVGTGASLLNRKERGAKDGGKALSSQQLAGLDTGIGDW
jgi:protein LSM14